MLKNNEVINNVLVQAYDNGLNQSFVSNQTLVIVNKFKCDAMRFLIDETSGLVTVQTLCSVQNHQQGVITVLTHSNVSLSCQAMTNLPNVRYQWLKNGVTLSDWNDHGNWTLNDVGLDQVGSYECLASNDAGTIQSDSTNIFVHGKNHVK